LEFAFEPVRNNEWI